MNPIKLVKCLLATSFLLLTNGCSPTTEDIVKEPIEITPTIEDREQYLDSNKFIRNHKHLLEEKNNYLTIEMSEEFEKLSVSEQYLYLIDFYEDYNKNYGKLYPYFRVLNQLEASFDDKEFPSYEVYERTFKFVGANLSIDREEGQKPSEGMIKWLDKLDKVQIMDGTMSGLNADEVESGLKPLVKETMVTIDEGITGALRVSDAVPQKPSTNSNSATDTETYIGGMNGNVWVNLTDNQKFHAVSNALYSLDLSGYTIYESEYFYISSLDAFYKDSSTMGVQVDEALASIGIISGTMTK